MTAVETTKKFQRNALMQRLQQSRPQLQQQGHTKQNFPVELGEELSLMLAALRRYAATSPLLLVISHSSAVSPLLQGG
jgi:hypothetical protein